MSDLNDRKDAFENKFAHDEGLRFKVEARTSKLFGLWVAEQLGLGVDEANVYAAEMVAANLEEAGFDDIKRKARPDLDAKGLDVSDHMLDTMLHKFTEEAKSQLMAE